MLLLEGVRIGERATCPSLGSLDGVTPDSEARHMSSGGGVPTVSTELNEEDTRRHRSGADLYRRKCDTTNGIRVGGYTTLGLKRKLHDEDCD